MKRTKQSIKSLKIADTCFDRRKKLSTSDKVQIQMMFDKNIPAKEIARKFGISCKNIYRYKGDNYAKYLYQQRVAIKKYNNILGLETIRERQKISQAKTFQYKCMLLDVKDQYNAK